MTNKSSIELQAIEVYIEALMTQYCLPRSAYSNLFEIAVMTAKWMVTSLEAKVDYQLTEADGHR